MQSLLLNIAIVEDDLMYQKMLQFILKAAQTQEVRLFSTANSLLESDFMPDVLLLDRTLPDADGLAILTKVHQKWPACKPIMLSADIDKRGLQEAYAKGAYEYLLKDTYTKERLLNTIGHLNELLSLKQSINPNE
ncbi:MAG: response regulator [Bacteroidota bacterium]